MKRLTWLLIVLALSLLYFFHLGSMGLVGPDEPRYASIAREMVRSGDWVTPRLWGEPWFEKPVLLYWMTGAAFRLGVGEDLAPRLPVALFTVSFLLFFWGMLRREFGRRTAWYATAILATSAGWLGFSHIGVTDLPMSAAFSASMLLLLPWLREGDRRWLPLAAALLGVAVLAKGLVPLVLALPAAWMARHRLRDLLQPSVPAAFLLVAAPWYLLCWRRNGALFLETFFVEHHFGRFASGALQHHQPLWFFVPVLLAAIFPWTPLFVLFRRFDWLDSRRVFLAVWALFGLVFFSLSANKLPGYILPLLPAVAALLGLSLAESKRTRWPLATAGALLVLAPVLVQLLPQALAAGLSRSHAPAFEWSWTVPALIGGVVWWMERRDRAVGLIVAAVVLSVVYLKIQAFPAMDRAVSARPIWREIASVRDQACIEEMHRSWRYGLNYYSVTPLPDCDQMPRRVRLVQQPGREIVGERRIRK